MSSCNKQIERLIIEQKTILRIGSCNFYFLVISSRCAVLVWPFLTHLTHKTFKDFMYHELVVEVSRQDPNR